MQTNFANNVKQSNFNFSQNDFKKCKDDKRIKDFITKLGENLHGINGKLSDLDKIAVMKKLDECMQHIIEQAANKSSGGLFCNKTSLAEENLFLLETAIDASKMNDEQRQEFTSKIRDKIKNLANQNSSSYFHGETQEKIAIQQGRRYLKESNKSAWQRFKSTQTIQKKQSNPPLKEQLAIADKRIIKSTITEKANQVETAKNTPIKVNGSSYVKKGDNVFDGNCGLQAVKVAFYNNAASLPELRKNMLELVCAHFKLVKITHNYLMQPADQRSLDKETLKEQIDAYKIIFDNDFNKMHKYILFKLNDRLAAANLAKDYQVSLQKMIQQAAYLQSFDDLNESICQALLKLDLSFNWENLLDEKIAHNPRLKAKLEKTDTNLVNPYYKAYISSFGSNDSNSLAAHYQMLAGGNGIYLELSEINILALKAGYTLEDQSQKQDGVTILKYKNLNNENDFKYIANITKSGQEPHWVCVELANPDIKDI